MHQSYAPPPQIILPCDMMFHNDPVTDNDSLIFERCLSYYERTKVAQQVQCASPGRQLVWVSASVLVILGRM